MNNSSYCYLRLLLSLYIFSIAYTKLEYEWVVHCLPNAKQIPFIGSLTVEREFRVIFSEMLFLTDTQITSGTRYTLKKTIAKTIPPMIIIKVLAGANSVYMVR